MKDLKVLILKNKIQFTLIGMSIIGAVVSIVKNSSQDCFNFLMLATVNLLVVRENLLKEEIDRLTEEQIKEVN